LWAASRHRGHLVGRLWRLSTATGKLSARLLLLMATSSAMHRCVSRSSLLRHGAAGCRAGWRRRGSAGQQGVPVVLPVREGSPGGYYGTPAERPVLCPAVFPDAVRLTGPGYGSSEDRLIDLDGADTGGRTRLGSAFRPRTLKTADPVTLPYCPREAPTEARTVPRPRPPGPQPRRMHDQSAYQN
jgi:hypothetical protein